MKSINHLLSSELWRNMRADDLCNTIRNVKNPHVKSIWNRLEVIGNVSNSLNLRSQVNIN